MSNGRLADVCHPERTVGLDPAACCTRREPASANAIDTYIDHQRHILLIGDPDALAKSSTLARLLLLGLVTGVESYFRGILTRTLRVCPLSRAAAGDQAIPYGSVRYYGPAEIELALFEGSSFSSAKEIRNRTQKVLGLPLPSSGSLHDALEVYQFVCELRHAAVHAHGSLTSANAHALRLPQTLMPGVVMLDLPALHALASTCLSVVRAYNRFLYEAIVQRWIAQQVMTGTWADDWRLFRELHGAFYSLEDAVGDPDARTAYQPVQARVLARPASR